MLKAIEYVLVGECKVDLPLSVKRWNLLCRIYKYKDTYELVEYTPKGRRKFKVEISKENAEYLINELKLRCVPSETFSNGSTYLVLN